MESCLGDEVGGGEPGEEGEGIEGVGDRGGEGGDNGGVKGGEECAEPDAGHYYENFGGAGFGGERNGGVGGIGLAGFGSFDVGAGLAIIEQWTGFGW